MSAPMWNAAVLVGRSISDVMTAVLCTSMVVVTGLVIGWRPDADAAHIVAGFAIPLLFAYALSWVFAIVVAISLVNSASPISPPETPLEHNMLRAA